jgi:hypothetical protein
MASGSALNRHIQPKPHALAERPYAIDHVSDTAYRPSGHFPFR